MSGHTKGPWIIEEEPEMWTDVDDYGNAIGGYVEGGEMERTGSIYVPNNDEDGTVTFICHDARGKNADLIAAAPELLDVVESFFICALCAGVTPRENSNDPLEALAFKAEMVAAKAKGEAP